MFTIDYKSRVPIYRQLVDRVEYLAARGLLSPGSQLPSVRALAVELSINPNTIAKAYSALFLIIPIPCGRKRSSGWQISCGR